MNWANNLESIQLCCKSRETLDKLLIAVQEQGQSIEDACDALGFDIMQATGLLARVDSYAFKRAQEPPFPDVKFYG